MKNIVGVFIYQRCDLKILCREWAVTIPKFDEVKSCWYVCVFFNQKNYQSSSA
jgi:hypothetical protein